MKEGLQNLIDAMADRITLRDYFAGQALNALINDIDNTTTVEMCASACYKMADAMIAERGKE
jgi:hypothetical protein